MRRSILLLFLIAFYCSFAYAQGTAADYERASGLKAKYEAAAVDIAGVPSWIGNTHRFWYRKLSRGVNVYMVFDADTLQKNAAFDHDKIAASLSSDRYAAYGDHKRYDFFVRHLLGVNPPPWTQAAAATSQSSR